MVNHMTPHHPFDRLLRSRTRQRVPPRPRRARRLMPLITVAAVLMFAAPATAQLSGVGQVTGTVEGAARLPDLPQPDLSTSLSVSHQLKIETPEIELDGHVYQVLSTAEMAAAQAQGATYLCGQVSSQVPAGLSSHADVCSHLDARALLANATGIILAVQTASGQWITMPDLHQQVSLDIEADADVDANFVYEAAGWLQAKAESTGAAIQSGAKGAAGGITGGFEAGIRFFGKLF